MKHKIILLLFLTLCIKISSAQNARFITDGVIEFEKTVNMHAVIKKSMQSQSAMNNYYSNDYIKQIPQFKTSLSKLTFSKQLTLFTPTEAEKSSFFDSSTAQINTTYTNLASGIFITQKIVFDENYLVKDSIRKINWKLTSEMRTIAGYECRRANAVIMDSIYVVAFYTDKIPVSGGPESFSGLPGMVLGVALPHDNITWFAKTVTDRAVLPAELKVPAKGKPVDNNKLKAIVDEISKKFQGLPQTMTKLLML